MNCTTQKPKRATNLVGSDERPRILLVEDAPFVRHAFGRLLRRLGFDVCEATDGLEALQRVSEFRPEVVLTDLMMPVMDGFELTRRLLAQPETARVPVVAITADSTAQTERKAREAGALDVITKPFDLGAVIDRLHALSDSLRSTPDEGIRTAPDTPGAAPFR
jgi:CheY-like chemotaxis protein